MPPIAEMIQHGSTNLWLFIPTAILLGALHGLEPGHSKTMMASFIIAVKGTMAQAALLGLCAALSHSLIVWVLAGLALKFGNALIAEQAEPYFMLLSAVIVIGVAIWMFVRTFNDNKAAKAQRSAPHDGQVIDTGHGYVEIEVFESGVPPKFRLHAFDQAMGSQGSATFGHVSIETHRPGGVRQVFSLVHKGAYWESVEDIPEPHAFKAVLCLGHGDHAHRYNVAFSEDEHPHHDGHGHEHHPADGAVGGYQNAHEKAHAEHIARRFVGGKVTTGQIAMFGLTGGLIPCPASVTILIICLHLKRFTLGAAMVASFSLGLAISMVGVGVIAAWGAQQVGKRLGHWGGLARKMPYFSSGLMVVVGVVMAIQGASAITG